MLIDFLIVLWLAFGSLLGAKMAPRPPPIFRTVAPREALGGLLRATTRRLGLWMAFGPLFRPILAPSWLYFGPSWPSLGPSGPHLGPILLPCWPCLGQSWPRHGLSCPVLPEFEGQVGNKVLAEALADPLAGNFSSTAPNCLRELAQNLPRTWQEPPPRKDRPAPERGAAVLPP